MPQRIVRKADIAVGIGGGGIELEHLLRIRQCVLKLFVAAVDLSAECMGADMFGIEANGGGEILQGFAIFSLVFPDVRQPTAIMGFGGRLEFDGGTIVLQRLWNLPEHLACLGANQIGLGLIRQPANDLGRVLHGLRIGAEKVVAAGARKIESGLIALLLEDVGEVFDGLLIAVVVRFAIRVIE